MSHTVFLQQAAVETYPPTHRPLVNYTTSSKNGKNQTFPFPSMALLFIAALLMSPDRRQSQSSRKFA